MPAGGVEEEEDKREARAKSNGENQNPSHHISISLNGPWVGGGEKFPCTIRAFLPHSTH
jgi:hypothetical protein